MKNKSWILIICLITLILAPVTKARASGIKILLMPFDTFEAATNLSPLRRSVLNVMAHELESSGAEVVGIDHLKELVLKKGVKNFNADDAIGISETVPADYAILGSITDLGRLKSVNWRVLDIRRKRLIKFYFKSDTESAGLLSKIRVETKKSLREMTRSLEQRPVDKTGIVDTVSIEGNRRVDRSAVLDKLESKSKEPFDPDKVKQDIVSIFGMGFFDDVQADYSVTATGRELKFIVKERPYLKRIEFKGNKEVTLERLKEVVTLKPNTVIDKVLIKESAEILKAVYEKEGFYLAKINPELTYSGVDAVLVFNIEEGPEVRVKKITIIGNDNFSSQTIKKLLKTKEKGFFSIITGSGKFDEFTFHGDINSITAHYFNNGYIESEILDQSVQLSEDKKWFYITIALKEGEQYSIGRLGVSGDILTTRAEVMEKIDIKSGEIFDRSKMSKGMEAVTFMYGDKGYANADVAPKTAINKDERLIDIDVHIKKNDLVYIERIDINGNTRTRDKVIRREVEVDEGDLYSSSGLKRSRNNLRRLGYFERVNIARRQGSAIDKIKLDVSVSERPTGSISAGLGFSSVDKIIATASVSQSNLMGTGIKLEVSGTISASSRKYILSLTQPWLFDKPLSAGFDIYNTSRTFPDFDMTKKGFNLRFGFPLYKRYTRGFLTYKYEEVEISDVSDNASNIIKDQEGTGTVSSLRAQAKHDTRNDAFFPTEGTTASASVEYAGGILGGNTNFIKYEASAVKFFPLFWGTSVSIRGMFGYVQSFAGKSVPIYERYFLGGINTIRGFATREVGPTDPVTGEFIGGEVMMVANLEYVFPLFGQDNLRGVLFYDAGNSYDGTVDFADIRHGAGFGVRWYSPVGPIRLELGFNLNKRGAEAPSQWEFAIGTAF